MASKSCLLSGTAFAKAGGSGRTLSVMSAPRVAGAKNKRPKKAIEPKYEWKRAVKKCRKAMPNLLSASGIDCRRGQRGGEILPLFLPDYRMVIQPDISALIKFSEKSPGGHRPSTSFIE